RLTLRADNADQRLTAKGIGLGCVGPERQHRFARKMTALDSARRMARGVSITPNGAARHGVQLNRDGQRRSAFEVLAPPNIGLEEIAGIWPEFAVLDSGIGEQLEIDAKYAVYLDRQAADVAAYRRDESLELQDGLDYATIPGLSMEVRQKLD